MCMQQHGHQKSQARMFTDTLISKQPKLEAKCPAEWFLKCGIYNSNFFNVTYVLIYFWLSWVGLLCTGLFSSCSEQGNGTPLQCFCLENPMDGGAWQAAVHGVAKSRTRLSDFAFTFHFHALEKEMATHSSVLAWRIPWTEVPGRLQAMGLLKVGND